MKKIILGVVFAIAGVFASQAQEISFEKEIILSFIKSSL